MIGGPLLTLLAIAATPGPRSTAERLDAGLASHPAGPERAVWAAGELRGAPYLLSPLGDASGPETGPRFRLDAFDCVTFVETAVALGNSARVSDAARLLDDIRYDGPPDYQHRNHYVEAQWVPVLQRKGWIADVTSSIAGPVTAQAELSVDAGRWRRARQAGVYFPKLSGLRQPAGRFELPLVPVEHLSRIAPRIPDGTIALVVREERPWRPYRVSHMGLVVVGPHGERLVRHATDVRGVMRVIDEPFERFVARSAAAFPRWPLSGLSFYAIRANPERAREILAPALSPERPAPAQAEP